MSTLILIFAIGAALVSIASLINALRALRVYARLERDRQKQHEERMAELRRRTDAITRAIWVENYAAAEESFRRDIKALKGDR